MILVSLLYSQLCVPPPVPSPGVQILNFAAILRAISTDLAQDGEQVIFLAYNEIPQLVPYINKIHKLPNRHCTFHATFTSSTQLALIDQVCAGTSLFCPPTSHSGPSTFLFCPSTRVAAQFSDLARHFPSPVFIFLEEPQIPPQLPCNEQIDSKSAEGLDALLERITGSPALPQDSDSIVVIMGSHSGVFLNTSRIAVYPIHTFTPFPSAQLLQTIPPSAKIVCVVERVEERERDELFMGPLFMKVVGAFHEAVDYLNPPNPILNPNSSISPNPNPKAQIVSFTFHGTFTQEMVDYLASHLNSGIPPRTFHFTPKLHPLPLPPTVSTPPVIPPVISPSPSLPLSPSPTPTIQTTSPKISFVPMPNFSHKEPAPLRSPDIKPPKILLLSSSPTLSTTSTLSDPIRNSTLHPKFIEEEPAFSTPVILLKETFANLHVWEVGSQHSTFRTPSFSLQPVPSLEIGFGNFIVFSHKNQRNPAPHPVSSTFIWFVCEEANMNFGSLLTVLETGEPINLLFISSSSVAYSKNIGLYVMTHCPQVYIASTSYSDLSPDILIGAADFNGPSLVLASDSSDWPSYMYDPKQGVLAADNSAAARLRALLDANNLNSLVVQPQPSFPAPLTVHNSEFSEKYQHIMKSFLKLASGISRSPILVMYASDGGSGEAFARKLCTELEKSGLRANCNSCDEVPFEEFVKQSIVVFVISTSGQGKFPLNAKQFWTQLGQVSEDELSLNRMQFGVFGLGDSEFWKPPLGKLYFCKSAKDLDKRMAALGALRLTPLSCGDDQDVGGPQEAFAKWLPEICKAVGIPQKIEASTVTARAATNGDASLSEQQSGDPKKELTELIRAKGLELGMSAVAFTKLEKSECGPAYEEWVLKGYHGEMGYLAREDAVMKRKEPTRLVPGAMSAIVATLNYDPGLDPEPFKDPSAAIFARYAQGGDYHDILKPKLMQLQQFIQNLPQVQSTRARVYVDTGPILERELARKAGLGWYGKNTMLIMPKRGSYFFLGVLLIDLELTYDEPFRKDMCGGCSACLPACPTGALLGKDPKTGAPIMDARRCISYLTIEQKGPIPRHLRKLIGNRIYGCDICQEVCPWNQYSTPSTEPLFAPRGLHGEKLVDLMQLSQADFSKKFKGSAIKRTKRRGLLRNAAVALGNWRNPSAIPVLIEALKDEEPLVRGHAAWALGQIGGIESFEALRERLSLESDEYVRDEILCSLDVQ
eukprot:Phypoly_transcript_01040.p1 GENE.Phypoly_transcript_01040~~Phypoly_transcript_01040.p1  ORF type:complete len:1215 (+),score=194.93 Phypoly_transcript_01040:66-3710(+)